jgi:hypothetical protein
MQTTDWIAAAAFAISLAALVSNLIVIWLEWPRIVVEVAVMTADASRSLWSCWA